MDPVTKGANSPACCPCKTCRMHRMQPACDCHAWSCGCPWRLHTANGSADKDRQKDRRAPDPKMYRKTWEKENVDWEPGSSRGSGLVLGFTKLALDHGNA